jgi:hypothetical protein
LQERPNGTPLRVFGEGEQRRIVFQVWDWAEDSTTYTVEMFLMQRAGAAWHTDSYTATYRALQRHELTAILSEAGFEDVRWQMPQDTGYYQPVVTARRGPGL